MTDNTNVESNKVKKNYLPQKLKDRAYNYDQTLLKVFGSGENKKIKLVRMNYLKTSGIELDDIEYVRGQVNENKINESILRSKSKIFELAFCNPWDWFFTGTINPNKQDRTDLELFHKQLTQWLRNYNRLNNLNIKFLFVPEKHKDGKSWHIHGFIYGLPVEHLKQFQVGDVMGKGLADKVQKGDIVYNWLAYFNRFGFCDLEPIRNQEAVSKYVTKYINKELANSVTELNAHTYYHSRGLKFAELKKRGTMNWDSIAPTYENDYCSVVWLDYSEELYNNLLNKYI
jgi:hypothetical protein